jgi:ketosteroid isomerase-like protein
MKNLFPLIGIFSFYLFIILGLGSCSSKKAITIDQKELASMIQTDKDFSEYSLNHGLSEAFIVYADSSAVYLRNNSMPIEGKPKIAAYFNQFENLPVKLSWEPIFGDISSSGDLGYTYGTYLYESGTQIQKGTYVSIWKKQRDGRWKWVLDTGNDGLE